MIDTIGLVSHKDSRSSLRASLLMIEVTTKEPALKDDGLGF